MATTLQNLTVGGLVQALGLKGYYGINAAADSGVNTTLDITIAAGAFAVLADGTILNSASFASAFPGGTAQITGVTSATHLYLDYTVDKTGHFTPTFTAANSAPSTSAITLGDITTTGGYIGSYTPAPALGAAWTF